MFIFQTKSNDFNPLIIVTILLLPLLFCRCTAIKPSTTKSGKKYFETFFVGEEGTQYFIKPLLFKGEGGDDALSADISYRYKNEIRDSATINFSIESPLIYKSIDSLTILNKESEYSTDKIDLLFNEKNNKSFLSRFSTKIPLENTKELFQNNQWSIITYHNGQKVEYTSTNKTEKIVSILQSKLFIIM